MRKTISRAFSACFLITVCSFTAQAALITFYYTTGGSPDVFPATYNTTTNSATTGVAIGNSSAGADGIINGPVVGGKQTLFFGAETNNGVFQIDAVNPQTPPVPVFGSGTAPAFLLAQNQNNPNSVFVFNNAGSVATLPIVGGLITNGTLHAVAGPDTNVSDMVWVTGSPTVYYVTGAPGTTGDFGVIVPSAGVFTTLGPLAGGANITTAQKAIFDPFTGLIILLGEGQVDTFNPVTNTFGVPMTLPGATVGGTCTGGATGQFNAGNVDGAGHALFTGCGNLYYFDYSGSGNLLAPNVAQVTGLNGAKDLVLPMVAVPEPGTIFLAVAGLGLAALGRRWRAQG